MAEEMTLEQKQAIALAKARQKAAEAKDPGTQKADAASVYVDEMGFGLPGKAAAGLNALAQAGIAALPGESPWEGKTVGELYDTNRQQSQNARERYADEHPVANMAASIAGSVHGGGTAGRLAGKAISTALPRLAQAINSTYAGRMAGDAVSGAAQGAVSAYGHDQDIGTGALIGGVAGGLARPVIDSIGSVARSAAGLIGVGNQSRAQQAVAEALARSGKSADDIATELSTAAAQGQPEYIAADAMGNAGQRMLTGVARSPGDMRQQIAEQLLRRQAGQGRRIQNALVEGFGAPQTKLQTEEALKAVRKAEADANYPAARAAAVSVDPTVAIAKADDFLGSGGSLPLTSIADDSVESTVKKARSLLTDGNNIVSDFDTAFRAKVELDNMIENASPTIQSKLIPIRNELDKALEKSSDLYANARDTFRRQSQDIEAANIGREASMRGRVEDTIPRFQAMKRPEQQASFRAGYVDPLIEDVQKTAGPMTNRARPLITDATEAEFPAFAAPGKGPQLMDRLGREQRMFETMNTPLGGSKTADNAADIADLQGFDPSLISAFATGGLKGAALHGLQRGINSLQGRNSATRDMIARMLLEGDPTRARANLANAVATGQRLTDRQEAIIRALLSAGATTTPRLAAGQ